VRVLAAIAFSSLLAAQPSADEIMAKTAANFERASGARRQYVYSQRVRSSLVQSNGQTNRREVREYSVLPGSERTEKKLVSFSGEYRKGKEMISYSEPGFETKKVDIDAELIKDLIEDLVDDKGSRDGIPHSLFPLRTADLPQYRFTFNGETVHEGRRAYRIGFDPVQKGLCENCNGPWKGEAWIDAEELQPVRIVTDFAASVPWAVRAFLGFNLSQLGFSVTYHRAGESVWFPAVYGTEFRMSIFWGYKRTVTLSVESAGFRKTDATSTIQYEQ
jgi:hypothetical protein